MKKYIVTHQACKKHKKALNILFFITYVIFLLFAILAYINVFLEKVLNFVQELRSKIVYGIFLILFKKDCRLKTEEK